MEFFTFKDLIGLGGVILTTMAVLFAPIGKSSKQIISDQEEIPKPRNRNQIILPNFKLSDAEYQILKMENKQEAATLISSIIRFLHKYLGSLYEVSAKGERYEDTEPVTRIPILRIELNKPDSRLRKKLINIINKTFTGKLATIDSKSCDYTDKIQDLVNGILEQLFSQSDTDIINNEGMIELTGNLVKHIKNI